MTRRGGRPAKTSPRRPVDNIVPLDEAARERLESRRQPSPPVLRMRRDVALMQGYADMLTYLPREQQTAVLRIIARKGQELAETLRPVIEQQRAGRRISPNEYRDTLVRTRALLTEYRRILDEVRARSAQRRGGGGALKTKQR